MDRRSLSTRRYRIKPAVVRFVDGRLFSPNFNDYYAARDPVAETVHVHLQPAQLLDRMLESRTFTIFEFGFGAGINFLTIAAEFLERVNSSTRLRFISCEAFPLHRDTISKVHTNTSVDIALSKQLLHFYPPLVSGIYRQLFAGDNIELTLIFTDIKTALTEFVDQDTVGVDSWILDGFTPDRNPEMWDEELFSILSQRTRTGGTVTTFSSAGSVRRGLEKHGFSVRRMEGTPFKRHTTLATLNQTGHSNTEQPKKITVVGGGFAGTSTARALARRGVQVQLLTPTGKVGDATSRVPTAVLHPRLSASMDIPAYIRTQTYFFSVALGKKYLENTVSGVVQLNGKNMSAKRLKEICDILGENWARWLDAAEFRELTGLEHLDAAVVFPKSFVVNGQELCAALVNHSHIEVAAQELSSPIENQLVVYATGSASILEALSQSWEVQTIEGQIDTFTHDSKSAIPSSAVVQDGYIVPTQSNCVVGSTYEYTKWKPGLATSTNLEKLEAVTKRKNWTHLGSFRGQRTITTDKLPIVGQISPNSWVNLAHGSAGTASTSFCAEILASQISREIAPIWQECFDFISPDRFAERQTRRPNPFEQYRQ